MGSRGAGVAFCSIAAFLFATRYVAAAIFGSGVNTWNGELFGNMLKYTGNALIVASVIALVVGVVYLIVGEMRS